MHKRDYNKLYVNKNREEGSEKIFLGYQNDSTEYRLMQDKETYFNIPPYTTPVSLLDSSLIIDGATGGAFPAVSDRIQESRKNYGNVSNNGTPFEVSDGTWFCSWLYKNPTTGALLWYDRYFNSKTLGYNPETFNGSNYILNVPPSFQVSENFIIRDVPTTMVLEPSVLYKYFHIGNKTARDILTTFEGVSGEHSLMSITNWSSRATDLSDYPITINSSVSSANLFPMADGTQVLSFSALGFDHNHDVEAYIPWNQNYIPSHDFTLGIWCKSNDWNTCPSTQLFGNYSTKGGFGVFVDTLKTYPYFVIPETTYGHLIYLNQESQGFLDKVVTSQLSSNNLHIPTLITMSSNDTLFVCSSATSTSSANLYKVDHVGNILASTTLPGNDTLISLMCDQGSDIFLTTSTGVSSFDNTLQPISSVHATLPSIAASAFSYNLSALSSALVTMPNVLDLKFIEEDAWYISADNNVYKNETMFLSADFQDLPLKATNLQVDPNGNLWVLHGNNNVSVYDPNGLSFQDPSLTFTVGTDFNTHTEKHISFIHKYDRSTLTSEWVSVIYYNDTNYIYTNTLDGKVSDIIDTSPFINYKVAKQLGQNPEKFKYGAKGDFTGYERKRVFNALNPNKQLVVKAALKDKLTGKYTYKIIKSGAPIDNLLDNWDPQTWKHILVTHTNRTLTLYLNGIYQTSFEYSGRYELSFEQQPSLFIGSPLGSTIGLNRELGSVTSLFNGLLGDIKFYDYSIDPIHFDMFIRAGIESEDMLWSLPIPSVSYIEKIERMFKNKLPGSKSGFYNIKLSGTSITDPTTRSLIEDQIKAIVAEISPIYADLVKIVWI